jgi:hypothetical protein
MLTAGAGMRTIAAPSSTDGTPAAVTDGGGEADTPRANADMRSDFSARQGSLCRASGESALSGSGVRETRFARLAQEGLSNLNIAAGLFMSCVR